MNLKMKRTGEEVFVTEESVTKIGVQEIEFLKSIAATNSRHRVRVCAHHSNEDGLHEMILVLMSGIYVQPHKHIAKSESFHLIEGEMLVVLFNEHGTPTETIQMGDFKSGKIFYYRLETETYHSVIPQTKTVVFHETTNGPFKKEFTQYAEWAPSDEGDPIEQKLFTEKYL
jgi:cupin fold WbuC family metalloprotein